MEGMPFNKPKKRDGSENHPFLKYYNNFTKQNEKLFGQQHFFSLCDTIDFQAINIHA